MPGGDCATGGAGGTIPRMRTRSRQCSVGGRWPFLLVVALLAAAPVDEFDGVQPAALDQPRVNLLLYRQPRGGPLTGKSADGEPATTVEAFLDTGASGVLLADHTAAALGVVRERVGHDEARFTDVGVGGIDRFAISERLFVSVAPSDAPGMARLTFGPVRAQVGPLGGGVMDLLARQVMGDLDVAGMPVMVGKVVVMDAKDVNAATDKIRTSVFDPRHDRAADVPRTRRHVRLSSANFAPYTTTEPPAAAGPDLAANPFIGPSPLAPVKGDRTPPVVVVHKGRQSAGSWLLDTGAATSMISRRQAAAVGVTYVPGTEVTDAPQLAGVPADRQFTLTVGGIGGTKKAVGFYLDRLTLRTTEGRSITYLHAPVLVADITAADARSGTSVTLDGVFGMNFLVASAKLSDGALPDIEHITPGPYRWIVFDQPKGLLGLD